MKTKWIWESTKEISAEADSFYSPRLRCLSDILPWYNKSEQNINCAAHSDESPRCKQVHQDFSVVIGSSGI